MHIVCPHCTTSYEVDPANFPATGRRVRCARCQEIWLAMPQELVSAETTPRQMDEAGQAAGFGRDENPSDGWQDNPALHVESPSISTDWPESGTSEPAASSDPYWSSLARQDALADTDSPKSSRLNRLGSLVGKGFGKSAFGKSAFGRATFGKSAASSFKSVKLSRAIPGIVTAPVMCMALSAVVFALLAWRTDVVRAMPQTAAFFRMIGMGVNLRGLAFEDLRISTETVNNKPVLLIEGAIIDVARKSVEIPRLRFIVRDAKGTDIYAWNAVLEQPVINPGEKAWFKTRLASPPPEGREIAVRFFHKLDIALGGV